MPTPILMPQLSPTMEEGRLAKWHVSEGDSVRSGDVVAEVETDKATMEVEAAEDGVIEKLLLAEGTEHVPVNHPIALLRVEGEGSLAAPPVGAPEGEDLHSHPAGAPLPSGRPGMAPREERATESETDGGAEEVLHQIAAQIRRNGQNGHDGKRIFASPLARRLARELGLDLGGLKGSGPHGRIVKADIDHAAREATRARVEPAEPAAAAEPAPAPQLKELVTRRDMAAPLRLSDNRVLALYRPGSYDIVPHDTMRKLMAERLTLSKQTIPHFYLAIDCDLDALLAARARLNALAPHEGPRAFKLSVNDFIIKAMAMALQSVPAANATWTEQGLLRHRASDIAVAVALEGGGLHTPVIRDAEIKSLSEISNEMRDLAARARSKRLAPHEYQGGSTTISNLGMYGIDRFDAVINPPQASILAVGRAEKRAAVRDDALKIATVMSVTLSVDHRVIDGALGAELLAAFKAHIEDPVTMLV